MDSSATPRVDPLVDLIFAKCALVYGRDFFGRWEGIDILEVKLDWQRELYGWLQNPPAIRHALETLPPGKPPDVLQFRELCRRRPEPTQLALPGPPADPERVAREMAHLRSRLRENGPKAWAYRLQERHRRGDNLTFAQVTMYQTALRTDGGSPGLVSNFRGVPPTTLPPAMRPAERHMPAMPVVPVEAYEDAR